MRDFLYKNSFIRYFAAISGNRNTFIRKRGVGGIVVAVVVLAIFLGLLRANTIAFVGLYLFILCGLFGMYRRNQPNVVGLMPLTNRRKIVYQFLVPLFTLFLTWLAFLIIGLFISALVSLIVLLAEGDPSYLWEGIFDYGEYQSIGGYAIGFSFIFLVICYSAGMIFGCIRRKRNRVFFIIGFLVFLYAAFRLMALPFSLTLDSEIRFFGLYIGSPFTPYCYEAMNLPWLAITLCALAAVGSVVGAVYVAISSLGTKKL